MPSKEIIAVLNGLESEIGANANLNPTSEWGKGFNAGIFEALKFIKSYAKGEGLFQKEEDGE